MITKKVLKKIEKEIKKDVSKELEYIKMEIDFFLEKDLDMYFLKEFVKQYPKKLLVNKAEILLETLLNYLMKEVLEYIKSLPPEIQYQFFKANLREKIKAWALSREKAFNPPPVKIKEEETAFEKTLSIIPGVTISAGGIAATLALPETLPLKLIPAASSLVGPIYILNKMKEKNKRLKRGWKKQIETYLKENKLHLQEWLLNIMEKFVAELNKFQEELKEIKKMDFKEFSDMETLKNMHYSEISR